MQLIQIAMINITHINIRYPINISLHAKYFKEEIIRAINHLYVFRDCGASII